MHSDLPTSETLGDLITRVGLKIDADTAQPESDTIGRYPVTGHLGAGGMGEILQIRDHDLGREIAAKVMKGAANPKSLAKFIREARITGQLAHPNIVPVYELAMTTDQRVYFTMKRVDGRTLSEVLRDAESRHAATLSSAILPAIDSQLPRLAPLLQILLKVCDAIAFAHSKGVIHRDLKPANIMVGQFGEVQVMDWGLAKVLGETDPSVDGLELEVDTGRFAELARKSGLQPPKTLDGSVCGTPRYMSPEQAKGEIHKLDQRSDIYALGALLYQTLSGTPPYEGKNPWSILYQVIHGPPPLPSEIAPERKIPWELEAVVSKAMSPSRTARYETVKAFKRDIEAWLAGRVLQAAEYNIWQVAKKWAGRNKSAVVAAIGIGLAVIVAFIGISLQLHKAREAEQEATQKGKETQRARDREQQERIRAQANERRAQQARLALKSKTDDFDRLADVQQLGELQEEAESLWPRHPRQIESYEAWLVKANKLAANLSAHQKTVARLNALPKPTRAQKMLLGALSKLVEQIKTLKDARSGANTIADISARLNLAYELKARSISDHAAWAQANSAIPDLRVYNQSPPYVNLVFKPIIGLVPIGQDPQSGLWEFAHLGTGDVPQRDKNGKLLITDKTGLVLVLIPPGSFMMGAHPKNGPNIDPSATHQETPVNKISVGPFLLSKYEMTQGQWMRATQDNPSLYRAPGTYAGRLVTLSNPVTNISWNHCRKVAGRLGLDLPTEAQWEYATRAGSRSIWPSTNDLRELSRSANLADRSIRRNNIMTWPIQSELDDGHTIHTGVGSFAPNAWGLHDLIGNVEEWCRDYYHTYEIPTRNGDGLRTDPQGPRRYRVVRGGSYQSLALRARSAFRVGTGHQTKKPTIGFRPSLNLSPTR